MNIPIQTDICFPLATTVSRLLPSGWVEERGTHFSWS